jgi:hypothetical protein
MLAPRLARLLPHLDLNSERRLHMSQQMVGIVIDRLLTDEDLRCRFAIDRIDTLAELCLQGFDLTSDEIDLFCRTDARLWFWGGRVNGDLLHCGSVRPPLTG